MAILLKMQDSSLAGNVLHSWTVPMVLDRLTVKELIEVRVRREVEKYNETVSDYYQGLVQPTEAEATINGFKMKKRKSIDPETQSEKAISGFLSNAFLVLVNDTQAESLEQEIILTENTEISFIKLTPLVGG